MLNDAIDDRDIGDRYHKPENEGEESMNTEENVQSNIDSQLCDEHSVTDDSDIVQKNWNDEVNTSHNIIQQTDEIIQQRSTEKVRDIYVSINEPSGRVTRRKARQQRSISTKTRNQLQMHLVSNQYL